MGILCFENEIYDNSNYNFVKLNYLKTKSFLKASIALYIVCIYKSNYRKKKLEKYVNSFVFK